MFAIISLLTILILGVAGQWALSIHFFQQLPDYLTLFPSGSGATGEAIAKPQFFFFPALSTLVALGVSSLIYMRLNYRNISMSKIPPELAAPLVKKKCYMDLVITVLIFLVSVSFQLVIILYATGRGQITSYIPLVFFLVFLFIFVVFRYVAISNAMRILRRIIVDPEEVVDHEGNWLSTMRLKMKKPE